MFEISRQLGHSSIGTTSDIYSELFEQQKAATAAAMDRALSGGQASVAELRVN